MRDGLFRGALVACAASLMACGETPATRATPSVLTLIDGVRVLETDSLFVGRPIDIAVAGDGTVYVSDGAQSRVLAIARSGKILRTFGRNGRGPGEFTVPSVLVLQGDSLLLAKDNGQQRLQRFDTRSGAFLGSTPMPPSSGRVRAFGGEILVAVFSADSQSSLARISEGQSPQLQGSLPDIARKHPMLLEPFGTQAFVVADSTVYSLNELSTSLMSWPLGSRAAVGVELPKTLRRGISTEDYETMMRDPAKAANLVYRHSYPMMLEQSASGHLVAAMYDVEPAGTSFTGRFYLTLIDIAKRRACIDIPVDVPEDPPARLTLAGDTLIAIVQDVSAQGRAVTTIRRFRIDGAACAWVALADAVTATP